MSLGHKTARSVFIPLLALAFSLGLAPSVGNAQTQTEVLEDVRSQGVHYYKRGRYKHALIELERARQMKGGDTDALTIIFLAKTYEGLRHLHRAFPLAERAQSLTTSGTPLGKRARGLLKSLRNTFGEVRVESDVASGKLNIATKARFLNKAKREHYRVTQAQLNKADSVFPLKLYLPYGDYTLNGIPFTVEAQRDSAQIVQIPSTVVDKPTGTPLWVYITGGVTGAVAAGLGVWVLITSSGDQPPAGFSHRVILESESQ